MPHFKLSAIVTHVLHIIFPIFLNKPISINFKKIFNSTIFCFWIASLSIRPAFKYYTNKERKTRSHYSLRNALHNFNV